MRCALRSSWRAPFFLASVLFLAACGGDGALDRIPDGGGASSGPFFVLEVGTGSFDRIATDENGDPELDLTIEPLMNRALAFADRPVRSAEPIGLDALLDDWRDLRLDEDPPTASLTTRDRDGEARVVRLLLDSPRLHEGRLRFHATAPDGTEDFPASFGEADLFIDALGLGAGRWAAQSFALAGSDGSIRTDGGDGRLRLEVDPSATAVVLSGAPTHDVDTIPIQDLVSDWAKYGFDESPPNASLSVQNDDGATEVAAVVLSNPEYDAAADLLRFDMDPIGGTAGLPAAFSSCDLFIDSAGPAVRGIDYAASHYDTVEKNSAVPWANIDSDFQIMASHFDTVRLYQLELYNTARILRAAERYGLDVAVSVAWHYQDDSFNNQQLALFRFIFSTYPELMDVVPIVIVGNEACADDVKSPTAWNAFYDQVSSWIDANWQGSKPTVTMSERWGVWLGGTGKCGKALRDHLPANTPLFANLYPFWSDCNVSQSTGASAPTGNCVSLDGMWTQITGTITDHPIVIGETGWSSGGTAGTNPVTVTPTLADAQTYWQYVYGPFATKYPTAKLFAFSTFDEPLKSAEGGSPDLAHHWGLYGSDGSGKITTFPVTNPVSPAPAKGTFVNIVPTGGVYGPAAQQQITIASGTKTYTYAQWFTTATSGYPWFEYGSNVSINLPAAGSYQATSCTNSVASGHGLIDQNLAWTNPNGGTPPCNQINWTTSGVYLP